MLKKKIQRNFQTIVQQITDDNLKAIVETSSEGIDTGITEGMHKKNDEEILKYFLIVLTEIVACRPSWAIFSAFTVCKNKIVNNS